MLFHTVDESNLAGWQSGLYYANSTQPKSSLAPTRLAMQQSRRGVVTHCAGMQLPVTPRVTQKATRLTLTCALDCNYVAQLYRDRKLVAGARGRAVGGEPKQLSLRVPTATASYRLRVSGVNPVNPAPAKPRFVALRPG
jgi:hypothetical protein